jgi:hypothetical protein
MKKSVKIAILVVFMFTTIYPTFFGPRVLV